MALATTIPNSSNSGFTLFIIQNEWSITVYIRPVYKRLSNTTWQHSTTDLKIDNLDRVSIPTKIVATFDVEHPILGTTYGI